MSIRYSSGRQFVQIPGPTNVPDRVLRAISRPTIDHRGPEFSRMTGEVLDGLKEICKTSSEVVIFPSSGSGAWGRGFCCAHCHQGYPGLAQGLWRQGGFLSQRSGVVVGDDVAQGTV